MQQAKKYPYQIYVLLAAFLQLVSPGVVTLLGISFDGSQSSSQSNPVITPAGYAFIVWGVITFLAFGFAIYQFLPRRKNGPMHKKLSRSLTLVYLLFCGWLLAASYEWLLATVAIFLVMFFLLTVVLQTILAEKAQLTTAENILLLGQVAAYTGWTTVAIFANLASALKYYGLSDTGGFGIAWQAVVLLLALANSVFWLQRFHRNVVYGATLLWAFIGVFFGVMRFEQTIVLQLVTLLAICIIAFLLVGKVARKSHSMQ